LIIEDPLIALARHHALVIEQLNLTDRAKSEICKASRFTVAACPFTELRRPAGLARLTSGAMSALINRPKSIR
jgi:hypothetical protein